MTDPTYPDAPQSLIDHWNKRRGPLHLQEGEGLAGLDVDLAALAQVILPPTSADLPKGASRHAAKEHELRSELGGQSELVLLHALVIAHLRKRRFPGHTPALFRKIWSEQSPYLLGCLNTRWLISAVITFGEHGATAREKLLGREMGMLFSIMKLYEFERLHSGKAPDETFGLRRIDAEMPLEMTPFSLASGGLDINLLAPLWQRAQEEPVMGPLAYALLDRLNHDKGGIFRRISAMRAKKQARIAGRKA
ncbi:hypothetical protein EOK75_03490 [Pseudorhodobacter turbinis]|uniref:Uncharacterized protein n=1 Tax=Pseudorhodobacter turbinis TaxID=2500533 RepID=A0A4P8EDD0_9RHOB|nr:hypothetical protein [Pseudorhodobacter turbinis]QCO54931.1 hypothetical protein EOK75_03490 [Pseudorhodobacter turbinis]